MSVASKSKLSRVETMVPGDHVCGIYSNETEFREQIVAYVTRGLERNEKVVYITHSNTARQVRDLLEAAGVDVGSALERGQLVFITAADSYLKEGDFDPDRMFELVVRAQHEAIEQGFTALRVTGEMTWALGGEAGTERLPEYEAKLNTYFPGSRSAALCQYDTRRFSPETLLEIIQNHPDVLLGREGYDNRHAYFVPPDGFLGPDRPGAVLRQWVDNLKHNQAER